MLSFKEFSALARSYSVVPVWEKIIADQDTPLSIFRRVVGERPGFLLESVEAEERWGRFSFIGFQPDWVFQSRGDRIEISGYGKVERRKGNPLHHLRKIMRTYKQAPVPSLPPFSGGAVGCFSYDVVRHIERLPARAKDDLHTPDAHFFIGGSMVIFDQFRQTATLLANARIDGRVNLRSTYERAVDKVRAMRRLLQASCPNHSPSKRAVAAPRATASKRQYESMVRKAKRYIEQGDVIQVALSRRLEYPSPPDALSIYRALRLTNPSPYMFLLNIGGRKLIGSSPEILVRLEGDRIVTRPIAGTRRRGKSSDEDRRLEEELRSDPKERAEHIMLVDLARNDAGRVSCPHTVEANRLMTVERYSTVMHLVSNVEGRLLPARDAFDVFSACFPAGTLTGAPKIRAMEIIEELEPVRRGFYAGCVGYFGFSGCMDMCITIRSILHERGRCFIQVGAGIVADSDPALEFMETENKALGLKRALDLASNGLDPETV